MKMIFAVIRDKDSYAAIGALSEKNIGVTKLASSGGFLREGNTTPGLARPGPLFEKEDLPPTGRKVIYKIVLTFPLLDHVWSDQKGVEAIWK